MTEKCVVLLAFDAARLAGANVGRGRRALRSMLRAQLRGVALRGQAGERHLHEVRIAHEARRGRRRRASSPRSSDAAPASRAELGEVVAFEDVEHLDQHDAAGGGRRHRDDVVAAIGAAHRRALDRAIVLQSSAVMMPPAGCTAAAILSATRPS